MKKDLLINIVITASIGVLAFVVNRIFSEQLGQEALGLMSLLTGLLGYLNLADLGIASASAYALYKPLSLDDNEQINIIVSTINTYYQRIAVIILVVGLLIGIFIPNIANTTSFGNSIYIYWFLYVLNTAWSYFYAKYTVLFTANQEYGFTRLVEGTSRVAITLLQVCILLYTHSFLLFVLVLSFQNIINIYFYKKHYKKHYSYIRKVSTRDLSIFTNMKNMFWHKIGSLVVFSTDTILLAQFVSLRVVAIYSTYLIVYQMILTIIGILTPVLTPRIGKFIANHIKKDIYNYWKKLHIFYLYASIILVVVTYFTINPFVNLWMGEEYLLPSLTIFLLLINLFISIIRSMIEVFKVGSGFYDDIYNPILESIINLVISFILVQKMGLNGVIIGTIASNIIIIYFLKPLMVFLRCFDKTFMDFIKDYLYFILLSMSTIIISYFLVKYLYINFIAINWIMWMILVIKILLTTFCVTTVIFLLDKHFRNLLKSIYLRSIKKYGRD